MSGMEILIILTLMSILDRPWLLAIAWLMLRLFEAIIGHPTYLDYYRNGMSLN